MSQSLMSSSGVRDGWVEMEWVQNIQQRPKRKFGAESFHKQRVLDTGKEITTEFKMLTNYMSGIYMLPCRKKTVTRTTSSLSCSFTHTPSTFPTPIGQCSHFQWKKFVIIKNVMIRVLSLHATFRKNRKANNEKLKEIL